jgi:Domain of unknown function (DUF4383)
MSANTSLAQRIGLAFGAFYVAIGVIGFFITGFNVGFTAVTGDELLGIAINPFHNLVHIGIGLILVIFARQKNAAAAEGAVMGVGLFYIVAFVIGVTAPDNLTILGIRGEDQLANFFHAVTGILLLAVGLISSGQTQAQMKRSGLA